MKARAVGWQSTEDGLHLRGRRTYDTTPELRLRRAVHALGLRFRLHRRIGRYQPDMVLPRYHVAVFVDGCYWHGCPAHGPTDFRGPNAARWRRKLEVNHARDLAANDALATAGWRVLRIWECEIKINTAAAARKVCDFAQAEQVT